MNKILENYLSILIYFIAFTGLTNILIFSSGISFGQQRLQVELLLLLELLQSSFGALIGPLVKQFGEMRLTLIGSDLFLACLP